MILNLSFPCVIRARPPRCISTKQVICSMDINHSVGELGDVEFPVAARMTQADGGFEEVRHDGSAFFRKVCDKDELETKFGGWMKANQYLSSMYLKLMEDDRNHGLEYNDNTWPVRDRRGSRKDVSYEIAIQFEDVDQTDIVRCETEARRLADSLVVCDGGVWIRCGEPCYRVSLETDNNIHLTPTYADQDIYPRVKEAYFSALDRDGATRQLMAAAKKADRVRGSLCSIEILDSEVFEVDFKDRAFLKFSRLAVEAIAGYLSSDGYHNPGAALMETDLEDIDTWTAARRCLMRMEAEGTCLAGDDSVIMRAAELWSRLGGVTRTPQHCTEDQVKLWFDTSVEAWLDRDVSATEFITLSGPRM